MCFGILFLASRIVLGNISQVFVPSSTWVSPKSISILQLQLDFSIKLSGFWYVCLFHYLLKSCKLCSDLWKVLSKWLISIRLFSYMSLISLHLRQGSYFELFFVHFGVPLVQLLHIKFLRMLSALPRGLPHLIKLFTAFTLYWELFWNILVLILQSAYLFLRVVSHLIYEILYSCFFYSSDYQYANKNSPHVSLCLQHYVAYILYNPQILEKLKSFLSIFLECLDITVVVPLYGCYLSISYYVPEILGNHLIFWIWIFEISCWDM